MPFKLKATITGILAGAANGFFGGGGGMLLVPLLTGWLKVEEKHAFATSVAIILPISLVSAMIYLLRGEFSFATALPYLIGGSLGGIAGGLLFKKVPAVWLKRALGILIIYGGLRCLF